MACRLLAVLHVSPTAGGRDQLLFARREYLLQDGLLSVSGDFLMERREGVEEFGWTLRLWVVIKNRKMEDFVGDKEGGRELIEEHFLG